MGFSDQVDGRGSVADVPLLAPLPVGRGSHLKDVAAPAAAAVGCDRRRNAAQPSAVTAGKLLPQQVTGYGGGDIHVDSVTERPVRGSRTLRQLQTVGQALQPGALPWCHVPVL